jgi:hypothetical protein
VSVETDQQGKPNVEFTADGALKAAELKIMNLRPGISKQLVWEEVSTLIKRKLISIFIFARRSRRVCICRQQHIVPHTH